MTSRGLVLTGACAVGLIAILAVELAGGEGPFAPPSDLSSGPAARTTDPDSPAAGRAAQVAGWSHTVLARPVFTPGRKPPALPQRSNVAVAFVMPRLTGVMVSPTDRTAIFAGPAGGKPLVLRTGSRIGNFMIETIEPGRVTVTGPDGSRVLLPSFDAAPRAAQPGSPPARAGLAVGAAGAAAARLTDAAR